VIASVILPCSAEIPDDIINLIIRKYRDQTIKLEIIISDFSNKNRNIDCDILVQTPGEFNLSKSRNNGSIASSADWLIFSDIDTVYNNDLFAAIININSKIIKGNTRGDTDDIDVDPTSYYKCGFAPMLIDREYFFNLGGYCEKYEHWGYEDSDFEHKLDNIIEFDTKGKHILPIHKFKNINWGHGNDANRKIFDERMKISLNDRIRSDRFDMENHAKNSIIIR